MADKLDSNGDSAGAHAARVNGAPELKLWFTREVLPLETALMQFLQHNWCNQSDIYDLQQEVYLRVYRSAREKIPERTKQFVFATARNLLIDCVRRENVVPI